MEQGHFQGLWDLLSPPTRSCRPPGSSDGGQRFGRFGSVDFIISAGPAERMLANGPSAASGFSSPCLHIGLSRGGLLLPRVLDVTSVLRMRNHSRRLPLPSLPGCLTRDLVDD